jgi:hypothetical protein
MEPMTEKRASTRVALSDGIYGRALPQGDSVRLRDLSLGGFAVETSVAPALMSMQLFEFMLGDGQRAVIRARAIHSLRISRSQAEPMFYAGFAFAAVTDDDRHGIDMLLNAALSAIA